MRIDGSIVEVGDQVYDVAFGLGEVTEVQEAEKRLVARFGERRFSYNAQGLGNFPMRTLYWRNPIQGPPPKDEATWNLYRKLTQAVAKVVLGG